MNEKDWERNRERGESAGSFASSIGFILIVIAISISPFELWIKLLEIGAVLFLSGICITKASRK